METLEYNIGKSDYSKHLLQPWELWEYIGNPWICDMVKRILRYKSGEKKYEDYKKINHILHYMNEKRLAYNPQTDSLPASLYRPMLMDELTSRFAKEIFEKLLEDYNLTEDMYELLMHILTKAPFEEEYFEKGIELTDKIIKTLF